MARPMNSVTEATVRYAASEQNSGSILLGGRTGWWVRDSGKFVPVVRTEFEKIVTTGHQKSLSEWW